MLLGAWARVLSGRVLLFFSVILHSIPQTWIPFRNHLYPSLPFWFSFFGPVNNWKTPRERHRVPLNVSIIWTRTLDSPLHMSQGGRRVLRRCLWLCPLAYLDSLLWFYWHGGSELQALGEIPHPDPNPLCFLFIYFFFEWEQMSWTGRFCSP